MQVVVPEKVERGAEGGRATLLRSGRALWGARSGRKDQCAKKTKKRIVFERPNFVMDVSLRQCNERVTYVDPTRRIRERL